MIKIKKFIYEQTCERSLSPSTLEELPYILGLPCYVQPGKKITVFLLYVRCLQNMTNKYKAYRPNAHLLYFVMHYNGNII